MQNFIVKNIKNGANSSYKSEINISALITEKKGACFDRSLFLQKILLLNNIKIRLIYLFFSIFNSRTTILDFFKKSTNIYNIFAYYYDSKWYVLKTNFHQDKPLNFKEYLSKYYPDKNIRYIKYLNNRNGYMIAPGWIPDIY